LPSRVAHASQYKGNLEPASVEHPDTPRAPDQVDITVLLAVTLHPLRHPLVYRSRVASAARVCWLTDNKGLASDLSTRDTTTTASARTIDRGYSPDPLRPSTLGKLAAVEKLTIP
jgi:hypothetical protein